MFPSFDRRKTSAQLDIAKIAFSNISGIPPTVTFDFAQIPFRWLMANRYFRWMIIRSWEKSKNALGALQSPHHVLSPTCRKAGPGHKSAGDPLKNHRKPAFKESQGWIKHGRILLTWRSFVDNLLSGVLLFLKINLITVQRKTIPWLHEITVMGSNFQFLIQIWTHIKIYIY